MRDRRLTQAARVEDAPRCRIGFPILVRRSAWIGLLGAGRLRNQCSPQWCDGPGVCHTEERLNDDPEFKPQLIVELRQAVKFGNSEPLAD